MSTTAILSSAQSEVWQSLPPFDVIFGTSDAMRQVREKMDNLAGTNIPILISGESGTGKEVLARALHKTSPWSHGPFVKVSCPAIPATLMESELFGYEKGAFTGAYGSKPGRVEMANRGTLFMDEIGELDPGLQAKLLQVLQDGQFCKIGAKEDSRVEARFVCATNRHLPDEIEAGRFRADLFYRINVVNLYLPPLRERLEDIPLLVLHFMRLYSEEFKRSPVAPSKHVINLLQSYPWPGNIRQLENVIKRYVIFGSEDTLTTDLVERVHPSHSMFEVPELDGPVALKEVTARAIQEIERKVILRALQTHRWNRKAAARSLKISYRALLYKIRNAGLEQTTRRATGYAPPAQPEAS